LLLFSRAQVLLPTRFSELRNGAYELLDVVNLLLDHASFHLLLCILRKEPLLEGFPSYLVLLLEELLDFIVCLA